MKRLVLTLMVAVATMLGVSALAPSGIVGAYPVGSTTGITTNVPSVPPGGSFVVTVGSCLPGETVVITFQGVSITVVCDPTTLQASSPFTAPTTPGTYQVCADLSGAGVTVPAGVTRPRTICTDIVVSAAGTVPPTTPGGGLPATGSNGLGTTTTSAIVLLGAGTLLLVVSQVRRRRTTVSA